MIYYPFERLIRAKTSIVGSKGKPGLYEITVYTECKYNVLEKNITVELLDHSDFTPLYICDIDWSKTNDYLSDWVC